MHAFLLPIVIGIALGLFTGGLLLSSHRGQFPSRPNGLTIQLFLAFVGSLIGALVVPAIFKPDFTAGVFISIGTAQFHTMRGLERNAWLDIDKGAPVARGAAYIDSMAEAFEARIFFILGVSAVTTVLVFLLHWVVGAAVGVVLAFVVVRVMRGRRLDQVAQVSITHAYHGEDGWYVNGMRVVTNHPAEPAEHMGLGTRGHNTDLANLGQHKRPDAQGHSMPSTESMGVSRYALHPGQHGVSDNPRTSTNGEAHGVAQTPRGLRAGAQDASQVLALTVAPHDFAAALLLNHQGQQQAILHTVAANVGVNPHGPAPSAAAYDPRSRQLLLLISPLWPDAQAALAAACGAPILESLIARRFPREVRWHRRAV